MSKIDTDRIKNMTRDLISYDVYEREEEMRKNKLKTFAFSFMAVCLIVGGTISVDALTDNSISNGIKNMIKITLNGEDYNNAKCEDNGKGGVKCTIDDKELGVDGEVNFEVNDDSIKDIQMEVINNGDEQEVNMSINSIIE